MTTAGAFTWSAIALAIVLALVFGFIALSRKLLMSQTNEFPTTQDDERAQRRRF